MIHWVQFTTNSSKWYFEVNQRKSRFEFIILVELISNNVTAIVCTFVCLLPLIIIRKIFNLNYLDLLTLRYTFSQVAILWSYECELFHNKTIYKIYWTVLQKLASGSKKFCIDVLYILHHSWNILILMVLLDAIDGLEWNI